MAFTTADLLASIDLRAFAPVDATTFSNTDILALADEEIQTLLVPHLMSMREEYFVTYKDIPVVSGTNAYDIPVRAIGLGVRSVALLNTSGGLYPLPLLNITDLGTTNNNGVQGFYLMGNSIILYPTPNNSTDIIRVHYQRAPSKLVEASSAFLISSVTGSPSTQVTSSASAPSTFLGGLYYDVIRQDGGQEVITQDFLANSVSTNTMAFTSGAISSATRVGDYVALANESPLVQFPKEYRSVLAQAVCIRILQSMRLPGVPEEVERLKQMLDGVKLLVGVRSIGQQKKIVTKNWW
jgi:hypothetical protein